MRNRIPLFLAGIFVVFGLSNWAVLGFEMHASAGLPPADARHGQDLRALIGAGELAAERNGESLYDVDHPAYVDIDAAFYFYPPWFAVAMAAIAWIPFHILFPLWTALGMAALAVALAMAGVERRLLAAAAVWLAVPTFTGVFFGQTANLMALGLAGVFMFVASSRQVWAGSVFALVAFKPHLLIGFAVLWLLDLRRWWRLVVSASAVTLGLVVASELWLRGSWVEFIKRLIETEPLASAEREVSLLGGAQLIVGLAEPLGSLIGIVLSIGVLVVVAWVARDKGLDPAATASIALVASLLVAPHSLAYDWVLLAVPLAFLVRGEILSMPEALLAGFALSMAIPIGFLLTDAQLTLPSWAFHLPSWSLLVAFAMLVRRIRAEGRLDPAVARPGVPEIG